ncbi:MAG: MFS transporter [Mycobacterium sp.]
MSTTAIRLTRSRAVPGTIEFRVLISAMMATGAMPIDIMLPAFDDIRADLGLDPGSNAVARLVTAFILGMALAQLPAGAFADRFGRRVVVRTSLLIYICGAALSALAPSLALMLVGRFIWGLGAAGARVVAVACVRDTTEGERMAREMSFVMAVFILVPCFAPSVGALILLTGHWRLVFWFVVACGCGLLAWTGRLPETLADENRQTLHLRDLAASAKLVITTVPTAANALAITMLFAVFGSYLASSEIIVDEVFGAGDAFPFIFGGYAALMGLASLSNARLVRRFGVRRVIGPMFAAYAVTSVAMVVLSLADDRPVGWLFAALVGVTLSAHSTLAPNLNSLAMAPVGAIAGSAAAMIGATSMAFGAVIGALIDARYDGTTTPITVAFTVAAVAGWICAEWGRRHA